MTKLSPPLGASRAWRFAGVSLSLLVAAAALGVQVSRQPVLQASGQTLFDTDGDGLTDEEEMVLATEPDLQDSDGDGWNDLEEISLRSDPLSPASTPARVRLNVGTIGRASNGVMTMSSVLYVPNREFGRVRFELGLVLHGQRIPVEPYIYASSINAKFLDARNPRDAIVKIELPFSESILRSRPKLSLYAIAAIGSTMAASALDLLHANDVTMSVQPAPASIGGPGLVYRPLTAPGEIPNDWASGLVCYKESTAMGSVGASIIHEITSSSCEPMDTYCSGSSCSTAGGSHISLTDPAALIGGVGSGTGTGGGSGGGN